MNTSQVVIKRTMCRQADLFVEECERLKKNFSQTHFCVFFVQKRKIKRRKEEKIFIQSYYYKYFVPFKGNESVQSLQR
jgi:hypothetical protein